MSNIVVYTSPTCGPCHTLKGWLKNKGVEFQEKNVNDNPSFREEAFKLSGFAAVPVTVIAGQVVVGPNLSKIADLL